MGKIMSKTITAWDEKNYMELLKSAIIKSNSVNRTGDKPMAALSDKFDVHLSYRLVHELDAAAVIKRLAEGLNLNGELAYIGMLMHDVGHPFSAHDGEEIFNTIGKLYNCGYFHHNAKGIQVIRAENIMNTAIDMIEDIQYRPELRAKLEQDFNYFLDIVISHDGEADPKDLSKLPHDYESIKEAVEDKLKRSNTKNDYKFVSQTPEGMLAKYADVIAYLSSDVRDGFRLGILKTFNDKYLEIFGRVISGTKLGDTEKDIQIAIEIAKAKIREIQNKHIEESFKDIEDSKNADILQTTKNIIDEINHKKINTYMLSKYYDPQEYKPEEMNYINEELYEAEKAKVEDKVNEILHKHLEKFVDEQGEILPEHYENLKADIIKITSYVNEMLYINTKVVNEVTNIVQEYFIKDLIENTKQKIEDSSKPENKDQVCVPLLSDYATEIYKKAKNFGYTFYVPQTKTKYQRFLLPSNVKQIVDYCANHLIEDGIIDRKLKDKTIRNKIPKDFLQFSEKEQQESQEQEKRNIKDEILAMHIKPRYITSQKNKRSKFNVLDKLRRSINRQGSRFADTYIYTCEAMEHQIRNKVDRALAQDYQFKEKEDILEQKLEGEINQIRNNILEQNPEYILNPQNNEELLRQQEQKEKIVKQMLEEERKKIVEKMAIQLSMDYISGMTDEGIKDLAINLGYMTQQQYEDTQKERGGEISETLLNLQKITSSEKQNDR